MNIKLLNPFEFIKAVSDTILDMINAAFYGKPLIVTRALALRFEVLDRKLYSVNHYQGRWNCVVYSLL